LRKLTVITIIIVAAIAVAIAPKPAFAIRDMRSLSTVMNAAEALAAGTGGAVTTAVARGTVKSLRGRPGKPVTEFAAVQAFSFSVSKSYTFWLIAAAKLLTSISILFGENYVLTTMATIVWIGVLGSAISALLILFRRDSSSAVWEAQVGGFISFVVVLVLAIFLSFI
jgi:hypothetical protein